MAQGSSNLPARYKGRLDIPYIIRGHTAESMGELSDNICGRLANGESLRSICRRENMPTTPTVFAWLRHDPAFQVAYTRAREHQAEGYADQIAEIADAAQGLDSAGVNAARLRVDARKWVASKLLPKRYGDRVDVNHQGGISVAAVSKALAIVQPVTFDEEGNELDDTSTEHVITHASVERARDGAALASKLCATDRPPHPLPPPPGKGTPVTVTACGTPQAQNPKIPPFSQQSSVELPTLSDLL